MNLYSVAFSLLVLSLNFFRPLYVMLNGILFGLCLLCPSICLQANWRTCKKFRNFKKKFPPFEGHNRRLSWEHLTITNDGSAFALEFWCSLTHAISHRNMLKWWFKKPLLDHRITAFWGFLKVYIILFLFLIFFFK